MFSQSPALARPSPNTRTDVAIQSPTTLQINMPANAFLYKRQSPRDNVTESVDAAARNLRRILPSNTSKMQLRPNTSSQRKAQPLFTSYLPDMLTDYNSKERKISRKSDAKRVKVSPPKRKTPHQKKYTPSFRITTPLYVWTTLFIANTIQYSTVNKQQLPHFERGAAFIFKYQVVTSESESQVRLFSPFPTLPDVNLEGVHAILRVSNQQPYGRAISRRTGRMQQCQV